MAAVQVWLLRSYKTSYAIVITAGHVMNEKQEATLFTQLEENSFQSSRNTFIRISSDIAIAAFKLDAPEGNLPLSFGADNLVVIDPFSIVRNNNLIALGYPGEKDANGFLVSQPYQFPSVLSFLNFENDVINAYGTTAAGMSGCPVVDADGTLIGFLLGFDPNLGDLIFQDPKHMRIQPITQELLDKYKIFVESIKGSNAQ